MNLVQSLAAPPAAFGFQKTAYFLMCFLQQATGFMDFFM
jgi:hypothetical protein